jgi:hypothetical protein
MGHRQHAPVVKLVSAGQFAIDFVSGSTRSGSGRVASLNYKIGNYTVESDAVVKAFFGQGHKILNGIGGVLIVKLDLHNPFFGVDFSGCHVFVFCCKDGERKLKKRNRKRLPEMVREMIANLKPLDGIDEGSHIFYNRFQLEFTLDLICQN